MVEAEHLRWRRTLRPFLAHAKQDLEPFINQALSRTFEPSGQMPLIVYGLARKCLKSFSSTIILGWRGYGEDAMLVARSMIEATVTAAFLEENPERAADYTDFFWIHEYRLWHELRDLDPEYAAELFPPARAEEAERRFKEVSPRFGIKAKPPYRGTWHRSSLPKLIQSLRREEYFELRHLYALAYRLGSDVTHASIIDLMKRVHVAPEGHLEMDAGPSGRLVAQALSSAHATLLITLAASNNALNLGIQEGLRRRQEDWTKIWPWGTDGSSSREPGPA